MKKLTTMFLLVILFVIIGIIGTYLAVRAGYIDTREIKYVEGFKVEPLSKPKPQVAGSFTKTEKTTLLSGICTMYGVIRNNGGTGYIDIEIKLHQKNKTFYREYKQMAIVKNEDLTIEIDF